MCPQWRARHGLCELRRQPEPRRFHRHTPADWNFLPYNIQNLTVDNIKAISWRGNGDGIDMTDVSSGTVRNIFIRSTDDNFAFKADPYFFTNKAGRPTENIVVEDSVNWADGSGHAIAFMEQTTPYIRNIQLRRIDIVHTFVSSVYFKCCDAVGEQYNITLDDIRVEDTQSSAPIFEFLTTSSGRMRDIYINNFQVLGRKLAPSTISGNVSNVTFNNLSYFGTPILSAAAGGFTIGSSASNIKFTQMGTPRHQHQHQHQQQHHLRLRLRHPLPRPHPAATFIELLSTIHPVKEPAVGTISTAVPWR